MHFKTTSIKEYQYQNKRHVSSPSKRSKYLLTYCIHLFAFDKYCLNQEKMQAAEIFLCGTEESDCEGNFHVFICKGKEMTAFAFVISMRTALICIRLKRTYEVVKGWARWAASYWQVVAHQQWSLCWGNAQPSTVTHSLSQARAQKNIVFPMAVHIKKAWLTLTCKTHKPKKKSTIILFFLIQILSY